MENSLSSPTQSPREIEVILGAGGIKGFGHIGVLKALEERNVAVGTITGVSVGSIIAALYTNGFTPDQLFELFLDSIKRRMDPMLYTECLSFPDPLAAAIGGCLNLYRPLQNMVAQHRLKANSRLRIVSCDFFTHEPVAFDGDGYDLAKALAASCSLPTVFTPQWHQDGLRPQLLVDGAVYHYNPTDFSKGTTIVSMFRPASEPACSWQLPVDLYFHARELYWPIAGHRRHVDRERHVVIEIGLPSVAGLNFGLSRECCEALVEDGYRTALAALDEGIAAGRIPVKQKKE